MDKPSPICYLCGQSGFRIRKGAVRDNPDLQILECTSCGLVTLSSLQHIRTGHYEDSGMHGESLPPIEAWLKVTESDDQRRFDMLKPLLPNKKVLDFGCGAGGFLSKALPLAGSASGIELERRVRDHWHGRMTIYPDIESAGAGYDLISAFHVVEHLPDPRSILKALAKMLAGNGRLVVEVPSSEDALLTLYDSESFQRFTYWSQHLFLFSVETLRHVAEQAGLRVLTIKQYQRYPLSNHLYWLSQGKPGGHQVWDFLDSPELKSAYASALAGLGKCDTLIAYLELA